MALLDKQGWRLLSNLESLHARTLKGKYFPYSSFLQAKTGTRPSWCWQSIIWGRQILEKGLRWHVGIGEAIMCKSEHWISKSFPSLPQLKSNHDPNIVWVAQLIQPTMRTWNQNTLRDNFEEEEVQNILSMPLSMLRQED